MDSGSRKFIIDFHKKNYKQGKKVKGGDTDPNI